jgi:hypothetical protein
MYPYPTFPLEEWEKGELEEFLHILENPVVERLAIILLYFSTVVLAYSPDLSPPSNI